LRPPARTRLVSPRRHGFVAPSCALSVARGPCYAPRAPGTGGDVGRGGHREGVQQREGVRVHLARGGGRRVRPLLGDRRRGVQVPHGGPGGRVRRRRRPEGQAGGQRPTRLTEFGRGLPRASTASPSGTYTLRVVFTVFDRHRRTAGAFSSVGGDAGSRLIRA